MKKIFISMAMQHGAKRIVIGIAAVVAVTFLIVYAASLPVAGLGTADSFPTMEGSQITDAGGGSTILAGDVGLNAPGGAAIRQTEGREIGRPIYNSEPSGALLNAGRGNLTNEQSDAVQGSGAIGFGAVDNQVGGKTRSAGVRGFEQAASADESGSPTSDANGNSNLVQISPAASNIVAVAGTPERGAGSAGSTSGAAPAQGSPGVGAAVTSAVGAHLLPDAISNPDAVQVFPAPPAATPDLVAVTGPLGDAGSNVPSFNGATSGDPVGPPNGATYSDLVDDAAALADPTLNSLELARIAAAPLGQNSTTTDNGAGGSTVVADAGSTFLLLVSGMAALFAFRRRPYPRLA